jgi:hypothetical protein
MIETGLRARGCECIEETGLGGPPQLRHLDIRASPGQLSMTIAAKEMPIRCSPADGVVNGENAKDA